MIVFFRSTDAFPDPRLEKYINYCEKEGINYHVVAWNRLLRKDLPKARFTYFNYTAGHGRKYKNLLALILWILFCIRFFIKNRPECDVVHCCDLDCAPVGLVAKLYKKNFLYDIFDWYGDSRGGRLSAFFSAIERGVVKAADHTILCDPERVIQVGFTPSSYSVMYNIPDFSYVRKIKEVSKNSSRLNLIYVGVLTEDRHLPIIIDLCKRIDDIGSDVSVTVAGFGPLQGDFSKAAREIKSLNFLGKITYEEAILHIERSDFMFAFYDTKVKNNIYAAPNKFYESLVFSTPLISNDGTILSEKIKQNETGFLVDPCPEAILRVLESSFDNVLVRKRMQEKCRELWDRSYSTHVDDYLSRTYKKIIGLGVNK